MVIISKSILVTFSDKHPDAIHAIINWYEITKNADWNHFAALKKTFSSAESEGNNRYDFDFKGNQYRMFALILFTIRKIFILFIGTHKEYDKIDASNIEFKK